MASLVSLTRREKDILAGILDGKSSAEVAETLFISKRTVDFHLQNIYGKLEVKNRMQAGIKIAKLGIQLVAAEA